ncbi:MAG TPA: M1 family metallopeptidase [Vicinamibacteria bacterium]|nr:M1 family metallopeptidase [Vicinamibacteria bacterium]
MNAVLLLLLAAAPLLARDVHSLANVEEVRPTHLSLDLVLDFEARRIRATSELTLAYADGAAPGHLDLDTRGLEIARVSDPASGRELRFELEAPVEHLGQRLRIQLGSSRPAKVRIEYATSPDASALQWLGPRQTTSGKPFLLTQSQAIHARSWIPCADSPGARVTYNATVRVPAGLRVVMSAEHLAHEPEKGVFRFRMTQSIPPYLLALAAGEIGYRSLGPRTGVYAEPDVLERAASEFRDVERMLEIAERLFGPYRWGRWDTIVLPPSFPFGGMENPRITFATPTIIAGDRSLVGVMAHELAHSWSGNLVTNATWADFWLNEGFTTYLENRIVEVLYGRDVAAMEALLGQQALRRRVEALRERPGDTALVFDVAGRNPDEIGTDIAYEKGANLLRLLERRFGRGRFDAFLRSYFEGNAFTSVTTARFLEDLKRELFRGDARAWSELRVEEWVYGAGIPPNIAVPSSRSYDEARAAAAAFATKGTLDGVGKGWVTAQWRLFLGELPKAMTPAQMDALDRRFDLTRSGNAEVLAAWLEHAARSGYAPAYPALEAFLTRVGRLKFLEQLYTAMEASPETRPLARDVYARARPGYHPIAVSAIDALLRWTASSP